MMSFYEELGVPNNASLEEIRQAYKILARVLHPDGQTDEKLKAAAARQMKRLHEILNILTDSRDRRAYDASLASAVWRSAAQDLLVEQPGKAEWAELIPFAFRRWSWVLLLGCAAIFGGGLWYVTAGNPAPPESASNGLPATPLRAPVQESAEPGVADRNVPKARKYPAPVPAEDLALAKAKLPALPEVLRPLPVEPSTPAPAAALNPVRLPEPVEKLSPAPGVRQPSFTGEWFYARAIEKPDPHLYPPVDIELQLTEKDGVLSGQYRGEYRVSDAALPQDVFFKVRGEAPAGESAALNWTGGDGAAGEIDLSLSQPNLMKVTWWATQLGRSPRLSSGAAILLRQQ